MYTHIHCITFGISVHTHERHVSTTEATVREGAIEQLRCPATLLSLLLSPRQDLDDAPTGATATPPKGKPPTKGFQQIVNDNEDTVFFYRNMILTVFLLRPVLSIAISGQLSLYGITIGSVMSTIIIPVLSMVLLVTMTGRSLPLYNNFIELKLINPGLDLSMPGGWADHFKDVIIILVLTHILTVSSPQFWYILLLLPLRALYLSWVYIILPAIVLLLNNGDHSRNNKCGKKPKKNGPKPKRHKYLRTIKHWHHFR